MNGDGTFSKSFNDLQLSVSGQTNSETYNSDGCHETFGYSIGLFHHIVKHKECG